MAQDLLQPKRMTYDDEVAEMNRAIAQYRHVQEALERDSMNAFVTIDADTGNYVVGQDRRKASQLFRETFGKDRPAWTLHIGLT